LGLVLPQDMPATNPATKSGPTFRGAVFTYFCDADYEIYDLPKGVSYLAYGHELCPTTSKHHLQGFAYACSAKRLTGWKKTLPKGAHIEAIRGSFLENAAYCSKEGQYKELGVKPMSDGLRRSDLELKDLVDADPSIPIVEHYERTENQTAMRYERFFERYREYKRMKIVQGDFSPPEVIFIHGPSGTGKTRYVHERDPFARRINQNLQWFDAYQASEAVVIDNLELPIHNKAMFLEITDRYPFQVPIKGGFTWWKPKRIYITSIHGPEAVSQQFTEKYEFYRRMTKIIECKKTFDFSPPNHYLSNE